MPGRVYAALFETAVEQYGYITAKDARELGFGPGHLVDLARRGDLDRVAHGLYRFKAVPVTIRDQLMEAALWPRGLGVISHATALDLWDLCDVNPAKVHVSVPKSERIRRKTPPEYEVHVRELDAMTDEQAAEHYYRHRDEIEREPGEPVDIKPARPLSLVVSVRLREDEAEQVAAASEAAGMKV
jgi:predicted transcriptional regulator of viral defense system